MTMTNSHLVASPSTPYDEIRSKLGKSIASSPTETTIPEDYRPRISVGESLTIEIPQRILDRSWFHRWLDELYQLVDLPPNWNGYGERQIHAASLKRATAILVGIDYDGPTPILSPRYDGGVQIEWHRGDDSLEIVVPPSGPAEAWIIEDDAEHSWVPNAPGGLAKLIDKLRSFSG